MKWPVSSEFHKIFSIKNSSSNCIKVSDYSFFIIIIIIDAVFIIYSTRYSIDSRRLRRKASVNDNNGQSSSSFAARPQSTVSRSNELQEEYYSLNELYKQQASLYEKLEVELGKLKEIYKNYYYKIDLINDLVHQKQSEFEILEHDIINDVEQEEKLTYSKLHENKIKLDGQFKELEFEMLNQLEDAKQFDFKELLTKIESLKQKR